MGRRKKQEYVQIEDDYDDDEYEDGGFFDDMKKEIVGIVIIALAILLGIAIFCGNDSGTLLDYINMGLSYLFGILAILFPVALLVYSLSVLKDPDSRFEWKWLFYIIFIMAILGSWVALASIDDKETALSVGGCFSMYFSLLLYKIGGKFGGYIILVAVSALSFILLTRKSFIGLLKKGARTAHEGIRVTRESLENKFYDDEDDEEYGYEVEENYQNQNPNKDKNFNIVLNEDEGKDEDDDEEDDEENEFDDDYEEYDEDEEDYEDEDEYGENYDAEDDIEIIDSENLDEDEEQEVKPLSHENFFTKIFKKKDKKSKKQTNEVVQIIGKEENPDDVAKAFMQTNEGVVDLGFWEENIEGDDEVVLPSDEEYDEEEYDEEADDEDEEYEEIDDDDYEPDDEDYEDVDEYLEVVDSDEEEGEEDSREIEIGFNNTKVSEQIDLLGNTPKMTPVATTDNEKDTNDKYEQKIKVNDPRRKKKEIKLIDEEGEEETVTIDEDIPVRPYSYPKMSFLSKPPAKKQTNSKQELKDKSKVLEQTLQSFKVNAKVTGVTKGPAVTRFELELAPGVKVSAIQNLADDIAMHMASSGVRIAPVPDKAAIGIEIANKEPSAVYMREVLDTEDFRKQKSKLAVPLGKGIDGKIAVMDIAKMPHILIAGSTGSGKSVCINTIITSIIYKSTPEEVKLIMVDPKVVELKMYADIPHLLIPVVTDPKKAAAALNWAVSEMLDRYRLFAENNVKNLQGYNELMENEGKKKLPQIVIIIDELADLMMAAGKEVEDAICRLAQMARAAGMHLIIATQRPSVDVITGLIKANVPSRIAFAVSSQVDSRTILDQIGAEKLLGRGDMLYYPLGANKPMRVQGAYVDESEIEKIVEFIKEHNVSVYRNDVLQKIENDAKEKDAKGKDVPQKDDDVQNGDDPLLVDALRLMIEIKKASITMFQRKFKIGYNRAANLMDALEDKGFVGPDLGTKPREVYFDAVRDYLSMEE
ncbi:MAG: DNA translocase FtsK [Clostridia bacterium]|nr:DNA translocase FtsK [Clostridia bacterium]